MLSPVTPMNGATLPTEAPDYEFTLNDVIYKCYYDNTNTLLNSRCYNVFALPAKKDLQFVSVDIDISLSENLNEKNILKNGDIVFVESEWKECHLLKTIELSTFGYKNIDLGFLPEGDADINVIVCAYDPLTVKFKNVNNVQFYYSGDTRYPSIELLAHRLVDFSDGFGVDIDACKAVALSPKVELKWPTSEKWRPLTFTAEGKPEIPLVGRIEYRVGINELKGLTGDNQWLFDGSRVEDDLLDVCLEIIERPLYSLIKPIPEKMIEYGFDEIRVTTDNGELFALNNEGYYIVPCFDDFRMVFRSGDLIQFYRKVGIYTIINDKIKSKWTPHSVSFTAAEDLEINEYEEGIVFGVAEYDKNWEIIRFIPFENDYAVLHSNNQEHAFDMSLNQNSRDGGWQWEWNNPMRCGFVAKVYDTIIDVQKLYGGSGKQYGGSIYLNGNTCQINFNSDELGIELPTSFSTSTGDGKVAISQLKIERGWCSYMSDLLPAYSYQMNMEYCYGDTIYRSKMDLEMPEIIVECETLPNTHSALLTFRGRVDRYGNLTYDSNNGDVVCNNVNVEGLDSRDYDVEWIDRMNCRITGLLPCRKYKVRYESAYVRKSDGAKVNFGENECEVVTVAPTWQEGSAEALTTTKARLRYKTNMDDVKDACVEWRRVDAPAVVNSNTAVCPVINGELVGILNNLNPDVYYQFRPVYEYNDIKTYGEWVGVFTGDANVWFDPEVTTGVALIADGGSVTLRGAVVPGSGDVSEQGFEVWPSDGLSDAGSRADIGHRFIKCQGISMTADVDDLLAGTDYVYRSYAKVDGTMYAGNEKTFTIPDNLGDIEDMEVVSDEPEIVGYYNLQGVLSKNPWQGLNIILYSDGTAVKRVMK